MDERKLHDLEWSFLSEFFVTEFYDYWSILEESKEEDTIASCCVFYYGCVAFLIQSGINVKPYLHDIRDYCLLYVLVDHEIDNGEHPNHPLVDVISQRLLSKYPQIQEDAFLLMQLEVSSGTGMGVLDELGYRNMALTKGGITMRILAKMSHADEDIAYLIGSIMQLLDDMMDVRCDMTRGINTIATCILASDGSLDRLLHETMDMVFRLPIKCIFFYLAYVIGLSYVVCTGVGLFSRHLTQSLTRYNILSNSNVSNSIVCRIRETMAKRKNRNSALAYQASSSVL